jgi:hypothetical protein
MISLCHFAARVLIAVRRRLSSRTNGRRRHAGQVLALLRPPVRTGFGPKSASHCWRLGRLRGGPAEQPPRIPPAPGFQQHAGRVAATRGQPRYLGRPTIDDPTRPAHEYFFRRRFAYVQAKGIPVCRGLREWILRWRMQPRLGRGPVAATPAQLGRQLRLPEWSYAGTAHGVPEAPHGRRHGVGPVAPKVPVARPNTTQTAAASSAFAKQ